MNNTIKNKSVPKNNTRKRCPKGERWNKEQNKCLPRVINNAVVNNTNCSKKYEPQTPQQQQRMDDLSEQVKNRNLSTKDLRNMISDLIGEERGIHKNQILGARMTDELIRLIICLENRPEPEVASSPEPEVASSPEPEVASSPEPEVASSPEPEVAPSSEPEVAPSSEPNETALLDNTELTQDIQNIQNQIGIEPGDMDSKEYNQYLAKKEKLEYDNNDDTYDFLYPQLNDPNFSEKIALRKEFNDTKFDGEIKDIKKQAEILCKADFELLPHQMFVKNFLSLQTPYNSLLLYHGLGTGKTCSAIGIAEEMRHFMKQVGVKQKILIVASPNVQINFRLQLFDERKLKLDGEQWNLNTCVGNSLLTEINPTNLKGISKDKITSLIYSLINKYYSFVGYTELSHYIQNKTVPPDNVNYTAAQRKEYKLKRIQKYFDNRLIIIDEVHNIRQGDDNKDKKKTSSLLLNVCKYANNLRLLLLSATPMYNSYKEVIWLTNLMNVNDNRSTISESDIFDKNGNFIESTTDDNGNVSESGKELLMRKLTGYVSFVRGENPYSFPYRIYPETFDTTRTMDLENYPTKQMNNREITAPLKHTPVYTNSIGDYQLKGYNYIIESIRNMSTIKAQDRDESVQQIPTFDNMESFGYTYLERPLQSLDIVYPNKEFDKIMNGEPTTMNSEDVVKRIVGKNGLMNIMSYKTTEQIRYNFQYKPETIDNYGRIFSPDVLPKYSGKISSICNTIMKSKGVIIVYSQYIDGGVVPVALALEELGFTRYGSSNYTKPLFSEPPTEPIDSISMKPKSNVKGNFKQAKYVMITGDKLFSPDNLSDIKHITNTDNKNGENVKVILITKAAAEGLDFKNVRQVHIMEPWYNNNRTEQIIGRGVRNLSHCNLPFEERNVEIYLHVTEPISDNQEEPADLYVYRFAEKKSELIGNVTRVMKEISVDCQLNIEQTNFTIDKLTQMAQNKDIQIQLSSNSKNKIPFTIGDKPFTPICDYMDNCNYQCYSKNEANNSDIVNHTYSEEFARIGFSAIVKRIRNLFKEQFFYTRNDLIKSINIIKKYPKEQIDFALTRFVNNKNEILVDKYGRNGYLINKDKYYVFQPMEITDEYASLIERSIPIAFKPNNLELELPVKMTSPTQERTIDTTRSDYATLIETLTQNITNTTTTENIKSGDSDWYKNYSKVYPLLIENNFSKKQLDKYVIHHFLDLLPIQDKVTVINHIFQKGIDLTDDDKIIKQYYNNFITDDNIIVLIDSLNNKQPFQIYTLNTDNTPIWNKVESEDLNKYKHILKKFVVAPSNINKSIFGFIAKDSKQNIIFKTRTLTDKQRNITGFNCSTAGKNDVIKKMNDLPVTLNMNYDKILKQGTCVIFELIFRKLDEESSGKRWFFDTVLRNKNVDTFIGVSRS